jgi:hypothetical protein
MRDMPLVLDLQTTMSVAEIIQPHREPTHPAVIPRCFGKGERLAHLALITQATGPVMTLHRTRMNDCVAYNGSSPLKRRYFQSYQLLNQIVVCTLVATKHELFQYVTSTRGKMGCSPRPPKACEPVHKSNDI